MNQPNMTLFVSLHFGITPVFPYIFHVHKIKYIFIEYKIMIPGSPSECCRINICYQRQKLNFTAHTHTHTQHLKNNVFVKSTH